MKHYFKYDSGYLNIDSNNLYLTNSGNWQEVRGLHEKSRSTARQNNARINQMKGFVYIVIGGLVVFALKTYESRGLMVGVFTGAALLAWKVFDYFKSDFGKQYKVPIVKITAIEKYEKGLKISFLNADNEPDFEIVDNVDPVGVEILTQLKIIKYDLGIS